MTVVLGGTRSGKSAYAESLARRAGGAVRYIATAAVDASDTDYAARIEVHRRRRPQTWTTRECVQPADIFKHLDTHEVVLLDSLGSWLVRHRDFEADVDALVTSLDGRSCPTVLVSEEVSLAVHPPSDVGRRYVDAMGVLNQRVAQVADRVVLIVAGRPLELGAGDLAP